MRFADRIGHAALRKPTLAVAAALCAILCVQQAFAAIEGPDVSSYQHPGGASIDWRQVQASGHSFAFVKATESTTYTNPYFTADWKAVLAAGMDRGPYHYARPGDSPGDVQANYFISVAGTTREPGDLPPVLDLEDAGGLSPTQLVSWTKAFLATVKTLTGRASIIYTYPSFWKTAMGNSIDFASYPLWIADYTGTQSPSFPLPGGWTSWTFWQYTDRAGIAGIQALADRSKFCCDFASLQALAFGSTTPQAPPPAPAGGTDLFASLLGGGTGQHVELHSLGQGNHYTGFSLHAATAFDAVTTPDEWRFFVAAYGGDGQPDLFGVHVRNTGSGRVEVHILSAASDYTTFSLHAATALAAVPVGRFQFTLGSFAGDRASDLYAIALNNTGSNTVEVHVLGEAGNYSRWLTHNASAFATVADPSTTQFRIADPAGSGDLVEIAHAFTGSGRTEVHVTSRASNYTSFTLHAATPLGYTSDSQVEFTMGDHDNDGIADLYAVALNNTASGVAEVHVLAGSSYFHNWIEHAATGLAARPTNNIQVTTQLRPYT